jgi:hypothetical protein
MGKGKLDEPAPAGDVFESLIDRTMGDEPRKQRAQSGPGDEDETEIDVEDDDEIDEEDDDEEE